MFLSAAGRPSLGIETSFIRFMVKPLNAEKEIYIKIKCQQAGCIAAVKLIYAPPAGHALASASQDLVRIRELVVTVTFQNTEFC